MMVVFSADMVGLLSRFALDACDFVLDEGCVSLREHSGDTGAARRTNTPGADYILHTVDRDAESAGNLPDGRHRRNGFGHGRVLLHTLPAWCSMRDTSNLTARPLRTRTGCPETAGNGLFSGVSVWKRLRNGVRKRMMEGW
jgi:hypothetical protein